jgi:CheY-like chemotaxis protein
MALRPETCDDRRVRPTVLVVDDNPEFRAAARALLEAEGFAVAGEAGDGAAALAAAARLRPAIVLLDVGLPDLDGFAVAERLAAELAPPPAVVLISSRDAGAYGPRLATAAALGFIAKRDLSGASLAGVIG